MWRMPSKFCSPVTKTFFSKASRQSVGSLASANCNDDSKWYEHNHEIHSVAPVLDILGVVLTSQLIHMLSYTLDMIL